MLGWGIGQSATRLTRCWLLANRSLCSSRRPFPVLDSVLPESTSQAADVRKSHEAEQELLSRIMVCQSGGGEKGAARHVQLNKKLLVRQRLSSIFDLDADFFELCTTAGLGLDYGDVPGAGTVTGVSQVHGVDIMVIANDATVKGGTSYPITVTKSLRAQEIAHRNRLPCLYIVDSGGAFLPLQADIFPDVKHGGRSFRNQAIMSSEGIPQIALVSGLCTAGGAYTPTMSDQSVMVHRISQIYLGGPPLVKEATGEVVTGEELGGAKLHCSVSGVADYFASTEQESFSLVRDIVASTNGRPVGPDFTHPQPIEKPIFDVRELDLLGAQPSLGSRAQALAILARIVDGSRFSEFKQTFGAHLVCGFALLHGRLVGLLIDFGPLTAPDGQKGAHFIQLCDLRQIPLIFLQNKSVGNGDKCLDQAELVSALKERAKMVHVQATATVPKISINVKGAFGDSLYTMCGPSFEPRFYFSWPLAVMAKSEEVAAESECSSSHYHAARCTIDGIILPRETRTVLAKCLDLVTLHDQPSSPRRSVVRI